MSGCMQQQWITYAGNDQEVLKVLLLTRSLKRTLTTRQIAVIISDKVSLPIGRRLQDEVNQCYWVNPNDYPGLEFRSIAKKYAQKWKGIKLHKTVFVDCNCIAVKNCDDLFRKADDKVLTQWVQNGDFAAFVVNSRSLGRAEEESVIDWIVKQENGNNKVVQNGTSNEILDMDEIKFGLEMDMEGTHPTALNGKDTTLVCFTNGHPNEDGNKGISRLQNRGPLEKELITLCLSLAPEMFSSALNIAPSLVPPNQTPAQIPWELNNSIAIVGMGCRYPCANSIDEFWKLLAEGREGIRKLPEDRWTNEKAFIRLDNLKNTEAGFLSCPIEGFDAKFFNTSGTDMHFLDPQQRLSLRVVWEALEHANIDPNTLKKSLTGVYGGWWRNDYKEMLQMLGIIDVDFLRGYLGNALGPLTARIAHFFELMGPAYSTESGCSTSVAGVDLACAHLRNDECNLAIVLGANLLLHPFNVSMMEGVLAPDGRCKTFDANANGFGRAEGIGVVVLKRFNDAVAQGDRIWGVIRGSAIVQEGPSKSMGTPTVEVEAKAMALALQRSGVDPNDVDFVETHGTGTIVGDPIEMAAITKSYSRSKARKTTLKIGSVKTNVGHTESCCGITSIHKIVLAMQHELIPKHLHFTKINPEIDLSILPAEIPLEAIPWKREPNKPRIAGVNSFGITGAQAHVIIQEPPTGPPDESQIHPYEFSFKDSRKTKMLTFSAKSEDAFRFQVEHYKQLLEQSQGPSLTDIEYTMHTGRPHMVLRATVIGSSKSELAAQLDPSNLKHKAIPPSAAKPICFLFTGQGSQYFGMTKELYDSNIIFATNFNYLDSLLVKEYGFTVSMKDALWSESHQNLLSSSTLYSQTSIFVVEICLLRLWLSWGVTPSAVVGHSLGEFAAAVAANMLSAEDALKLVVARSKLIDPLPKGSMLVVAGDLEKVQASLEKAFEGQKKWVDIAAVNSNSQTVLAGDSGLIQEFREWCKAKEIKTHLLDSSHAFHSRMMDPMLEEYEKIAKTIKCKESSGIVYISGVDGKVVEQLDAKYWVRHTRERVRFLEASRVAARDGFFHFVEIGPHPVLTALVQTNYDEIPGIDMDTVLAVGSLRRGSKSGEWETLLSALAKLYSVGYPIVWENFHRYTGGRKIDLPGYHLEDTPYWMNIKDEHTIPFHPLVGAYVPNASDLTIFKSTVNVHRLPFLKDHALGDKIIFPCVGYVDMCMTAGYAATYCEEGNYVKPNMPLCVRNFSILTPVCLSEMAPTEFQVIVSKTPDGSTCSTIYTKVFLDSGASKWVRNATATFSTTPPPAPPAPELDLALIKSRCTTPFRSKTFDYKELVEFGFNFGPSCRTVHIGFRNPEVEGEWLFPFASHETPENHERFIIHPWVTDPMLQTQIIALGLLHDKQVRKRLVVPVQIDNFTWWGHSAPSGYVYMRNTPTGNAAYLLDEEGKLMVSMVGTEFMDTTLSNILSLIDSQKNPYPSMAEYVWKERLGPKERRVASEQLGSLTLSEYNNDSKNTMEQLASDILAKLSRFGTKSVVRVLEMDGGLAPKLIPAMSEAGTSHFQYTYARAKEESPLDKIEEAFEGEGITTNFPILDISKEISSQGFTPGYFDVIICPSFEQQGDEKVLEANLINLRKLLRTGGYLIMNVAEEATPSLISRVFGSSLQIGGPVGAVLNKFGFEELVQSGSTLIGKLIKVAEVTAIEEAAKRSWLIFGETNRDVTQEYIKQLNEAGCSTKLICRDQFKGKELEVELGKVLAEELKTPNIQGIVYGWSLLEKPSQNPTKDSCEPFLYICKQLLKEEPKSTIKVAVLTRGNMSTGPSDFYQADPCTSPLIGMANVLANESQEKVSCKVIDLDSNSELSLVVSETLPELFSLSDPDVMTAYRSRQRFTPRLRPYKVKTNPLPIPQSPRYRLYLPKSLEIADLRFAPCEQETPQEGQVEVEVRAYALNFLDVLMVTKPDPVFEKYNYLGVDIAGIVTQAGPGCKNKVGQRVVVVRRSGVAMPSHLISPDDLTVPIPDDITFSEAATFPMGILTVATCLIDVAKATKDDIVLIHTASGGVGLVGIQIAQRLGCTVVVTAGNERKRNYLKEQGVQHVFNSRNTDYATDIRKALGGRGVTIVLNSLTQEGFKEATLGLCEKNARFVEMSKMNIWSVDDVKALRPDVFYEVVDVSTLSEQRLREVALYIQSLLFTKIEDRPKPLPYTRYDVSEVREALTFMEKVKHIGKIVLTMPTGFKSGSGEPYFPMFDDRSSYIITGGLGGIGLEVGKWMATSGARTLVLLGRSEVKPEGAEKIEKLKMEGIRVEVRQCDVGNIQHLEKIFAEFGNELPPLRGIMHAAGVLDDAMYENQTWSKYETVYNPKVLGAWNLHQLSLSLPFPLEHFVVFSSITATIGAIGQSNYVAANQYLDALVHYRYSLGLPAISINWGQWGQVGMAANTIVAMNKPMTIHQGLAALEHVMKSHKTQVVAHEADLGSLKQVLPAARGLLADIEQAAATSQTAELDGDEFWREYDGCPGNEEKLDVVKKFLKRLIRITLKMDKNEEINDDVNFQDMGMDSLLMVEMKNGLQASVGKRVKISINAVKDCKTVTQLGNRLVELISGFENAPVAAPTANELRMLVDTDALLPTDIKVDDELKSSLVPIDKIATVLLIGSTGMLGPYVLREIFKRDHIKKVYCLMLPNTLQSATERFTKVYEKKGLLSEIDMKRVECIEGDVKDFKFGIKNQDKFNALLSEVDAVFNLSVKVAFEEIYRETEDPRSSRVTNVYGTKNVLKFAVSGGKLKYVFHASTFAAETRVDDSNTFWESWPSLDEIEYFPNSAYSISKLICDKLVEQAVGLGVPCKVFRLPQLGGDSIKGGNVQMESFLILRCLGYMYLGCMHASAVPLSYMAVDECAKLSVELFFNKKGGYEIYNVLNPHLGDERNFDSLAREFGVSVKPMELGEFLDKCNNQLEGSVDEIMIQWVKYVTSRNSELHHLNEKHMPFYTAYLEGNKNVFWSKKLETLLPGYPNNITNSWEVLRKDLKFVKEAGMFDRFNIKYNNTYLL